MVFYKLNKKIINKNISDKIYLLLKNKLKGSIFNVMNSHFFFNKFLKKNLKNVYIQKKNKEVVGFISFINKKNKNKLRKNVIIFFIKNFFLILKLIKNIKFLFKYDILDNSNIELFHLILSNSNNKKIEKYKTLNKIFKINSGLNKTLVATYENKNVKAMKFYKKNFFKIKSKNLFYTCVEKKY